MNIDNKKKYILVLGEVPAQGLDDTITKAEARYFIDFSKSKRFFWLHLHYNGSNSLLSIQSKNL